MSKLWPGRKMRSEAGIGGSGCFLSEMTSNVTKDAAVFCCFDLLFMTTRVFLVGVRFSKRGSCTTIEV